MREAVPKSLPDAVILGKLASALGFSLFPDLQEGGPNDPGTIRRGISREVGI